MGNSTVKFVFRALIGTVIAMLVGVFVIEYINLSVTSYNVRDTIELSLYNACNSFNQESYRSTGLDNLQDNHGNLYMSGDVYNIGHDDFYGHFYGNINRTGSFDTGYRYDGTAKQEYKNYLSMNILHCYESGSETMSSVAAKYEDLEYVNEAYNYGANRSAYATLEPGTQDFSELMFGLNMVSNKYTPMNLNAVYLGRKEDNGPAFQAVTNLFKWNLTQLWSNCSEQMRFSENGRKYVQRSGWRVYTDTAQITGLDYYIYNVKNGEALAEMAKITNISQSYYKGGTGRGNNYVMVARLSYDVEVEYVGITPMSRVFSYINNIGDRQFGGSNRDYTIGGGDTGLDITRDVGTYDDGSYLHIKTDNSPDGDDRKYYVYYYNIT